MNQTKAAATPAGATATAKKESEQKLQSTGLIKSLKSALQTDGAGAAATMKGTTKGATIGAKKTMTVEQQQQMLLLLGTTRHV